MPRCFENGNGDLRVCATFDQFLPVHSHFDTKRPVNFFHIPTFPSPTFGPLFAFHCPLFFTKNNNLECRDVLKTVTAPIKMTGDRSQTYIYTIIICFGCHMRRRVTNTAKFDLWREAPPDDHDSIVRPSTCI